jgi:hypothetical protein
MPGNVKRNVQEFQQHRSKGKLGCPSSDAYAKGDLFV